MPACVIYSWLQLTFFTLFLTLAIVWSNDKKLLGTSLLTGAADIYFNQSVNAECRRSIGLTPRGTSSRPHAPRFLQSTGFQCATALCSRLWCWCGSVLTAQLPATSPNSAFLLPLLQVVSISGQPRQAYLQVHMARTTIGRRSFAVAGPSLWNSLPAALRRPEMTLPTFKRQLKAYLFHI